MNPEETAMVELKVDEMTCGHCVRAVTQAVRRVDPQAEVEVDLGSKRVRVEGASSPDDLIRALDGAGYAAVAAVEPKAGARAGGCCGCR
jgi:copper chaperone